MSFVFGRGGAAYGQQASGPIRWVRRIVLLAFAMIQLLLVARVLLDLGVIPADWPIADQIATISDALAAPVEANFCVTITAVQPSKSPTSIPMPITVTSGFRMLARCPGLFIQASTTRSGVGWPAAMFSLAEWKR